MPTVPYSHFSFFLCMFFVARMFTKFSLFPVLYRSNSLPLISLVLHLIEQYIYKCIMYIYIFICSSLKNFILISSS